MEKTPWFPAQQVSPVRVGWYETSLYGNPLLFWNGSYWSRGTARSAPFPWRHDKWRGLVQRAEAA